VYNKENIETGIAAETEQPEQKTLDTVVENSPPEEPMKTTIESTTAPVTLKKLNGQGLSRENPLPFDQTKGHYRRNMWVAFHCGTFQIKKLCGDNLYIDDHGKERQFKMNYKPKQGSAQI
jgi:hypothetical protein